MGTINPAYKILEGSAGVEGTPFTFKNLPIRERVSASTILIICTMALYTYMSCVAGYLAFWKLTLHLSFLVSLLYSKALCAVLE